MARFEAEMAALNKAAEERITRFEAEMRQSKRDLDKKWGDLSNKMGTIVEDILAPNLPRLAKEHFAFSSVDAVYVRANRRHPKEHDTWAEFDVIVAGPEAVLVGEAKSTSSDAFADQFAEKVKTFLGYFPEYEGRKVIPIFGTWSIHPSALKRFTQLGIYAMQMGEDTMELINTETLDSRYLPV